MIILNVYEQTLLTSEIVFEFQPPHLSSCVWTSSHHVMESRVVSMAIQRQLRLQDSSLSYMTDGPFHFQCPAPLRETSDTLSNSKDTKVRLSNIWIRFWIVISWYGTSVAFSWLYGLQYREMYDWMFWTCLCWTRSNIRCSFNIKV